MATVDVPADEWPEFLDAFSRRHRAWLTRVEPPISGLGHSLPLGAVTTERDGRRIAAIEVSFVGDSDADAVRIENPVIVRVRQTSSGDDEALEIVDHEGVCTRFAFRTAAAPEMLDGLAPGELSK